MEFPDSHTFLITYLPSDPGRHAKDPLQQKRYYQSLKERSSSSFIPWVFLLLSIAVLYFLRKASLKELANRKEMEELRKRYS
jgi:hypothetical protein